MLTHPTHGRLVTLGLTGMAKALDEQQRQPDIATLAFEERLALLVDREATERENKRLVSRLRFASLRQNAVVEDIDMKAPRGLDKALFQKLVAGEWIERYQNLLIIGPTGVGKSWIACALGHRPVGITARSSINAYRDCSMCSRLHAATAITPGSSKAWRASSF
jgi:DNA replication protein DnaC